jgi:energy-coupling factor transporter ATP-binding protein EcfA2
MVNPFSTRHTRPGAVGFRFPPGQSAEQLVEQLRANQWRGQVLGPHGSGKSTLLAALLPLIEQAGKRPLLVELHEGQRRLPDGWNQPAVPDDATLVIVDGYEQLARWNRYRLNQLCRRRNRGLLITAHTSVGLPDLFTTAIDFDLAWQLVTDLLGPRTPLVTPDRLRARLEHHRGNLREVLFDLYDLYEQRPGASAH